MKEDNDGDYISVGQWMLLLLVPAIPIIGWLLVLILAFVGGNQTRKNYFRAMLAWIVLVIGAACLIIVLTNGWPKIHQYIHDLEVKHV
jgi:hypothetical protein